MRPRGRRTAPWLGAADAVLALALILGLGDGAQPPASSSDAAEALRVSR